MKGAATRVWVVSVPVTDFEKALAFYRDLLGMKVQLDGRMFNWMELGPDEPLCKIGLYEAKGEITRRPPIRTGITLDTDDIGEFHSRLSSKGVKFSLPPEKQPWGGIQADFLDVDGNTLSVVQDPGHYKYSMPQNPQ